MTHIYLHFYISYLCTTILYSKNSNVIDLSQRNCAIKKKRKKRGTKTHSALGFLQQSSFETNHLVLSMHYKHNFQKVSHHSLSHKFWTNSVLIFLAIVWGKTPLPRCAVKENVILTRFVKFVPLQNSYSAPPKTFRKIHVQTFFPTLVSRDPSFRRYYLLNNVYLTQTQLYIWSHFVFKSHLPEAWVKFNLFNRGLLWIFE